MLIIFASFISFLHEEINVINVYLDRIHLKNK